MMNRGSSAKRIGGCIALTFLFIGMIHEAPAADWPQLLGPTRNGISTETGLLQAWPREGPALVWERKVGAGFSGPVVAGERVILFHRIGSEEIVECMDAKDGKSHWKYAYPTGYRDDFGFDDGPRSTPLVANGRVFTLGAEGTLTCLDLENGKKIWARSINTDYGVRKGFFGVGTSPILEGDRLLVNVGGKGAGIVAFERETGKEIWKATDQAASYASPVAATIAGDRHVIFFTREGLVSLDPQTGAVRFDKPWRARINASVNAASPVVAGDRVFASTCYNVGAMVLQVGKSNVVELWKNDESLSNHYNTSVHSNGYLYGIDGRQEEGAKLRCVEMKSGKVQWTREGFGCASMIHADGHLIALDENGVLVLIEATPKEYREKARATVLSKPCRDEIALANGCLFARDTRKLVCLRLTK